MSQRLCKSKARGSALLLALVLMAILAVVGMGLIKAASGEGDAAAAKRRYDKGVSCADAARDLLMAQFRTYGVAPTQLTLNSPTDDQQMLSGHYGDSVAITSVKGAQSSSATSFGVTDIANRTSSTRLGGQVYRMAVVCRTPAGFGSSEPRQTEVEFLVKFGL